MKIDKIFENDSVNVVFATNNKYAKYMVVAIQSLINHANDNRNYDIIVFETDIEASLKNTIENLGTDKPNISVRCLNVASIYDEYDRDKLFCHIYFSKEMYLRLFIPQVLQDYEKAIYLDCDTIIQSDIAELFDDDISEYYLAASRDYNSIVNIMYYPKVNYYFKSVIKIKNMDMYFNSGVLLMNLTKLRPINLPQKTFELLDKYKELLYPDQDLLNLICVDHVKILDSKWNFVFGINPALVHDNRFLPLAIEWSKGLAEQKIIHYISEKKPWDLPNMSYADIWWKYAKAAPIYQILLKEYFDAHPDQLSPTQTK